MPARVPALLQIRPQAGVGRAYAAGVPTPGQRADGLLERERELGVLTPLLRRAGDGRGGAARLLGPAGVGKTSLLRAVADQARALGFRILTASASPLETQAPYGVARRLFEDTLTSLDPSSLEALATGPARVAVSQLLGTDATPVEQGDMLGGLFRLLAGLTAVSPDPLLVIVDDAQWADEESLLFLASLRERLAGLPVAVVVSTREVTPTERSPALATLIADRDAPVLRLGTLSAEAVATLLAEHWGDQVPPAVAGAAYDETGGNPFLVVALAHLLADGPVDELTADLVHAAVPGSVVDAVVDRLAPLGEEDRALAHAVAVLEAAPTRIGAELAGLAGPQAEAAADRLRAAGLLAESPGLAFRHALLRSAVTSSMGAAERGRLHRAAARLLADDTHAAAAHLLNAEGTADPWAVATLRRAAAESLAAGAPSSAVTLLQRAVQEPPEEGLAPVVRLELGLAQLRTADPACGPTLAEAEQALTDPGDRARCSLALAQALKFAGRHEAAAEVLERAYAVLGGKDAELDLELEANLAAAELLVPERIRSGRDRLAARRDLTGATRGERLLLLQQLSDAAGTNQPAGVIRTLAHRCIGDGDGPEQDAESTEWVWAQLFLISIGDFEEVRRLARQGQAGAAERGSVIASVTTSFIAGQCEFWAGRLTDAEAAYLAMLEHASGMEPDSLVHTLARSGLAQTLARQGRAPEALAALAGFPEQLPADAPVNGLAALSFGRAMALHGTGDHLGALRAVDQVARLVRRLDVDSPTWASWRPLAIAPLRDLGRQSEARELAAEQLALCRRSEVPHLIGQALMLAGSVAEDPETCLTDLAGAVELLDGAGSPVLEGEARLSYGAALRRTGRRAAARDQLGRALHLLSSVDAVGPAEMATVELAAAGVRAPSTPGGLTVSELRVAELAAQGLTNSQIARRLYLAPKTVETHLSRIYRKLGIDGRHRLSGALRGDRGRGTG